MQGSRGKANQDCPRTPLDNSTRSLNTLKTALTYMFDFSFAVSVKLFLTGLVVLVIVVVISIVIVIAVLVLAS